MDLILNPIAVNINEYLPDEFIIRILALFIVLMLFIPIKFINMMFFCIRCRSHHRKRKRRYGIIDIIIPSCTFESPFKMLSFVTGVWSVCPIIIIIENIKTLYVYDFINIKQINVYVDKFIFN